MSSESEDALDVAFDAALGFEQDVEDERRGRELQAAMSRGWRRKRATNTNRKARSATSAVARTRERLGWTSKRTGATGRRARRNVVSCSIMLDMAVGGKKEISSNLPSVNESATAAGFSRWTAQKARSIIVDCLMCS